MGDGARGRRRGCRRRSWGRGCRRRWIGRRGGRSEARCRVRRREWTWRGQIFLVCGLYRRGVGARGRAGWWAEGISTGPAGIGMRRARRWARGCPISRSRFSGTAGRCGARNRAGGVECVFGGGVGDSEGGDDARCVGGGGAGRKIARGRRGICPGDWRVTGTESGPTRPRDSGCRGRRSWLRACRLSSCWGRCDPTAPSRYGYHDRLVGDGWRTNGSACARSPVL